MRVTLSVKVYQLSKLIISDMLKTVNVKIDAIIGDVSNGCHGHKRLPECKTL